MAADRITDKVDHPPPGVGIYLHIPFCVKKCFYCDFYSVENHSQREDFLDAIVKEIDLFSGIHPRLEANTIFFGGGTPSLLKPSELERILAALRGAFNISESAEFTMECNPGTIDTRYLSDYHSLGVNRISFGVQSFFEDDLRFLERIHGPSEAIRAVDLARGVGFDNLSLDLIYALPGQTHERLLTNLQTALSLNPDHLSAYGLIVEPGTPLFNSVSRGTITPAPDTVEADMYGTVMDLMEAHSYSHYEISNYCKPGFECKHNLKYWNAEDYIGFGPSAHSYFDKERWWNVSSLAGYVAELKSGKIPVSARESLGRTQLLDEFVLLHLRQGVLKKDVIAQKFGIIPDPEFVADLVKSGYCIEDGNILTLTKAGFKVSDEIAETMLARHLQPF